MAHRRPFRNRRGHQESAGYGRYYRDEGPGASPHPPTTMAARLMGADPEAKTQRRRRRSGRRN